MKNEQIENLRNKVQELLKSNNENINIDTFKNELSNIVNDLSTWEYQLETKSKLLKKKELEVE